MRVRIICHARWEISFEFFSFRNYFEPLVHYFIFWFSRRAGGELDEYEDEEGDLFLFSCLDLDFFCLFLLKPFTISGLDEGEVIFLFLVLFRLSCFLVEEVSRFSDTLFPGSSYELSPAISFFLMSHHWS